MRFERKDDVQEHEEREDERLNETYEQLKTDEGENEARHEQQFGEDGQDDLPAPDVPPKSKREREDPEELARELDRADEDEHDTAHERTLFERREVDPAGEITDPVLTNAGRLVPGEARQRETEIGVVVGGRRVEKLDLTHEGHDEQPVAEESEEKEAAEERKKANDSRAARLTHEVGQRLDNELEQILKTPGLLAQPRRRDDREDDKNCHDDPRGEDRVRDRDVIPDRDRAEVQDVVVSAEREDGGAGLVGDMNVRLRGRPVRKVAGQRGDHDREQIQRPDDGEDAARRQDRKSTR